MKYSKILRKTKDLIGKHFENRPIKSLAKMKLRQIFMIDYQQKKTSCLTHILVLIDSVFKSSKTYYSQTHVEECK